MIDEKEYQRLLELQNKWYSNNYILIEMFNCLKGRAISFIVPLSVSEKDLGVRYFYTPNSVVLKKHLEVQGMNRRLFNTYMSVALLKEFPYFTYDYKKRKYTPEYKEFDKNYDNYILGYNFLFDMDCKEDFEKGHKEAKEFKKILEENKVPFWIMNSSSKGFHIHCPFEYFDFKESPLELIGLFRNLAVNIKGIYNFESLDTSIFDSKRICKVPYSFVVDGTICLPLTDEQFNNFNKEMVSVDNVLKNIKITKRRLLIRTYGLSYEELKKNTIKFINEYK